MTQRVELVFFEGCPHAAEARRRLKLALEEAGVPAHWDEWDTGLPETPTSYLKFGSPTVLVDGQDVTGGAEGSGMGCVVSGAPEVAVIAKALRDSRE